MANHQQPKGPPSQQSQRTLEDTAALLVQTAKERDELSERCRVLSLQLEAEQAEVHRVKQDLRAIQHDFETLNRALAEATKRIQELLPETGEGNGQPIEWLTMAKHAEDDFRVLRLVTPGVPPRAIAGESSLDHVEAEERFRVAAADLFERVERDS